MFSRFNIFTIIILFFLFAITANAATFTVTKTADTNDLLCNSDCSLREAMYAAQVNGVGADTIEFNIPGSGVKTINLTQRLATIYTSLTINGTTQPGYAGTPLIELNGSGAGEDANGLKIQSFSADNTAINVTIMGLAINRFSQHGILSECNPDSPCNLTFLGNFIGTNAAGTVDLGNGLDGIHIISPRNSSIQIGSTGIFAGNLISGNDAGGIYFKKNTDDFGNDDVKILGNFIGTNIGGTSDLGNTLDGIFIDGDEWDSMAFQATKIGGSAAGSRNIISGNDRCGILGAAGRIDVLGNYIGTNAAGTGDLGNKSDGIHFEQYVHGTIGGITPGEGNVISGNDKNGIFASTYAVGIYGNYIGTNAAGTADLGNTLDGIYCEGGPCAIGGTIPERGNVISGNNQNGISLYVSSEQATVEGNRIGTNAAGTGAIANSQNGILFRTSQLLSRSYEIGSDTDAGGGNLISGNTQDGIHIQADSSSLGDDIIEIYGNKIGTDINGAAAIPNLGDGIEATSDNNIIGKAGNNLARNIISGNAQNGIKIDGSTTNGNKIENNFIGTNASGTNLGNGSRGVLIQNSALINFVGGAAAGAGNTIAFNGEEGVLISSGTGNYVRQNSIYSNGKLGIDLGTVGVTPNDVFPGDPDTGANGLQNFPVLKKASSTQVYGTINSAVPSNFDIDFYRVDSCDASGNGEGKFYLGSTQVTATQIGETAFNVTALSVNTGQFITATATDPSGNTSEFSQCLTATPPPGNIAFSSTAFATSESTTTYSVSVLRNGGTNGTVTVVYTTSNGTATGGSDYTPITGTLTFSNGEAIKTFDIQIANDHMDEPDETINLTLSNPTGGAFVVSPATAVLTISDNDNPPTISINDVSINEGNEGTTNFNFNVTLSAQSGYDISVNYATSNGTANAPVDYISKTGTLTFSSTTGETSKTITVAVNSDFLVESEENFFINLSNPTNVTIADGQGIGTIFDDDNPGKLQFSASSSSVSEAAGAATIFVSRTNGSAGTVTVDYTTSNGTATAGSDYQSVSGTLTFTDGQTSASFNIPILQDSAGEADESVFITLINPLGGATLNNPSTRTLIILDDDGGLPSNVSIDGNIVKNNLGLQNVLITLTGSQSKTTLTDAQGNYQFTNLPPGGNYLITPTLNGHNFEPFNLSYNNLSANITDANFIAATGTPSRTLRVVTTDTIAGNQVVVPIELVSQGNENSIGFSLSFDANLLSNAQVSLGADAGAGSLVINSQTGKIGIIVGLPSGQTFAAGNRQIATVTFSTAQTALYSTPLSFTDQPIAKEITDANAGVLPTAYADGAVTFAQGYEADVAPRPTGTGNGSVTVADYTQVGRFVAGLNTPDQLNEFQRVDCSPRGTKGNGVLSVSDYTQAGRYAAGLDVINTAGGPSSLNFLRLTTEEKRVLLSANKEEVESIAAPTIVRVVNTQALPNSQVIVSIVTDTQGTENGFGFSVNYDTTKLSNPLVQKGTDTQTMTLIPNTTQSGKIGVIMAMPAGQTLTAGAKQLITIRFDVALNVPAGPTPLTFNDAPVFREIVDADANPLQSTFQNGVINIGGTTAANVSVGGRITDANGNGLSSVRVSLTNDAGEVRTVITNPFGFYNFADVAAGETYIVSASHKRYQFTSQVITVMEETNAVILFASSSR